jgi:hypothetical protein
MVEEKVKNEHPILFSGPMVRAIREGRKTQTRRILKKALFPGGEWAGAVYPAREQGWIAWSPGKDAGLAEFTKKAYKEGFPCPYGEPGDRLWVRETWVKNFGQLLYRADCHPDSFEYGAKGWKPSIFMPRVLSRITLDVVDVRAERLQDISDADILAEGITVDRVAEWTNTPWSSMPTLQDAFRVLWNTINPKHPWESNPYVWVVSFREVSL